MHGLTVCLQTIRIRAQVDLKTLLIFLLTCKMALLVCLLCMQLSRQRFIEISCVCQQRNDVDRQKN